MRGVREKVIIRSRGHRPSSLPKPEICFTTMNGQNDGRRSSSLPSFAPRIVASGVVIRSQATDNRKVEDIVRTVGRP